MIRFLYEGTKISTGTHKAEVIIMAQVEGLASESLQGLSCGPRDLANPPPPHVVGDQVRLKGHRGQFKRGVKVWGQPDGGGVAPNFFPAEICHMGVREKSL